MGREGSLFLFDRRIGGKSNRFLAGVDEAGRGPLAGPVVAAAVVFRRRSPLPGLNDSKQVLPEKRRRLFWKIIRNAMVGIGTASPEIIDEINILQATRLAMRCALLNLCITPSLLLIDGPIQLDFPCEQYGILEGDGRSAVVAAASIVAKVFRDHHMENLDKVYPVYGFAQHKGYATPEHLAAIGKHGITPVHRKTFAPVADALELEGTVPWGLSPMSANE